MTLRTCPKCGANLDPEERCEDCARKRAQAPPPDPEPMLNSIKTDGDGQLGFDMPKPPPRGHAKTAKPDLWGEEERRSEPGFGFEKTETAMRSL